MASYYTHKYDEFGDQVLRAGYMIGIMADRADAMAAAAISTAPVATGDYISSFHVTSGVRRTGRTRRAFGRVTNTSAHAMAVEFGFGGTPKYRCLGRALSAGGGDIRAGV